MLGLWHYEYSFCFNCLMYWVYWLLQCIPMFILCMQFKFIMMMMINKYSQLLSRRAKSITPDEYSRIVSFENILFYWFILAEIMCAYRSTQMQQHGVGPRVCASIVNFVKRWLIASTNYEAFIWRFRPIQWLQWTYRPVVGCGCFCQLSTSVAEPVARAPMAMILG